MAASKSRTHAHPGESHVAHDVRIEPMPDSREFNRVSPFIWGERDIPDFARHLRGNAPVDRPLPSTQAEPIVIEQPAVWCGLVGDHFGHFIAEQSTRLLFSALHRPDDIFLFQAPHGVRTDQIPQWFWSICEWYGISPQQVQFITEHPVLARELRVFPQAEHLVIGPRQEYLDALDAHVASMKLRSCPLDLVYVSRAGIRNGRIGAEEYFEKQLEAAGATVVRPEGMPLREQLECYATARTLIFSEGSAIHGRQLLGRFDQHIVVLLRRKGGQFASRLLRGRCRDLTYVDGIRCSVHFSYSSADGRPKRYEAFPLTDASALLEGLQGIGLDLTPGWDDSRFERALITDLDYWATTVSRRNRRTDVNQRIRLMEGSLYAVGRQEYVSRLAKIARDIDAKEKANRHVEFV